MAAEIIRQTWTCMTNSPRTGNQGHSSSESHNELCARCLVIQTWLQAAALPEDRTATRRRATPRNSNQWARSLQNLSESRVLEQSVSNRIQSLVKMTCQKPINIERERLIISRASSIHWYPNQSVNRWAPAGDRMAPIKTRMVMHLQGMNTHNLAQDKAIERGWMAEKEIKIWLMEGGAIEVSHPRTWSHKAVRGQRSFCLLCHELVNSLEP